jgi:hypothetical protein
MAVSDNLPLFSWKPECQLIPFPLDKRIGKARKVAATWLSYPSTKEANGYARRIDADLVRHLQKIGIREAKHRELCEQFWNLVRSEVTRQRARNNHEQHQDERA